MDLFCTFIEYLSCLCEAFFAYILFAKHLGIDKKKRVIALLLILPISAGTFFMNRQNLPWYFVSIVVLIELYCYSMLLFRGTKTMRAILGVTPSIVFILADHIVVCFMMIFVSNWTQALLPANQMRLIGIAMYIAVLGITLAVSLLFKRNEGELPAQFGIAPIAIATIGVICILLHETQYERLSEHSITVLPCAITNTAIVILCAAFSLLLHFASIFYKRNLNSQKELQYKKLEKDHIEQIGAMYEYVREWRHDMSGLLATIDTLARDSNFDDIHRLIVGLNAAAKDTALIINSGNPAIDATVSGKLMTAKEAGIRVNFTIAIPASINIDQTDVCSVLINLFDNAIYATSQLEAEKRSLDIGISLEGNMLKIAVKNPCRGEYSFSGKELLSTKKNSLDHGIGLKRVKRIAENHDGFLQITPQKNSFEAVVLLATEGAK